MLKLNGTAKKCPSEYTSRPHQLSDRSWNTVGTMDSIGSEGSLSPDPTDSGGYFRRVNHETQSGSSLACDEDDRDDEDTGNVTDHLQTRRGAILSELLAELHAFAEYVVYQAPLIADSSTSNSRSGDLTKRSWTGPGGGRCEAKSVTTGTTTEMRLKTEYDIQVVERRKRIISHLSELCDEEDEEEDDDDDDDDEAPHSETTEGEYVLDQSVFTDGPSRTTRSTRQQQRRVSPVRYFGVLFTWCSYTPTQWA